MSADTAVKDSDRQQLARLHAEVEALRSQLRAAQRLAAVGTMTAMVAHEFNNILTPIISYAQLAKDNPALTDKALARAADGGQRATSICQAILGMTRGEVSSGSEEDLGELVRQTVAAMARDPSKDGIELVLDVPDGLKLLTRRVELQQVLLNLLINARSAVMERGGIKRIELAARRHRGGVMIRVADTGVGIAPENLQRIFEPFFTTKAPCGSAGHGLGLAICREIIVSMGGQISVRSTPGEGTCFTIRLPAKPARSESP